jgi:5-methylcytosine-specific restriction enzyme subunit McrC
MLSYAYKSLRQNNYDEIKTEYFENVHDLFAAILAKGISSQIKHGLVREYIERQDNLSTVKGKINLRESIQLKMRKDPRISCCFDVLSENNYMNKILKSAALSLVYNKYVKRENKDELKKVILFFSDVDKLEPSAITWHRLNYNRINTSYRMLMNVCYLVLHDLLLTTEDGKQKLAAFLDDQQMSRLYEKFILEYCKKHFSIFYPASKEIKWDTKGTENFLPKMQSDIMLVNGSKKLIIDAKYYSEILKTQYAAEKIRSNHLYQIYAYVKNEDKNNTGLVEGLLLYAKTDENVIPNVTYELGGNRISVKTLDLGLEFAGIEKQLYRIVNEWTG